MVDRKEFIICITGLMLFPWAAINSPTRERKAALYELRDVCNADYFNKQRAEELIDEIIYWDTILGARGW